MCFFCDPALGVCLALQLGITRRGRRCKFALFIIVCTQDQVAGMIILCLIRGIAQRKQYRISVGIQIFHFGGRTGFQVICLFPGCITITQHHRPSVGSDIHFIGHIVSVIVLTLYPCPPADQSGHVFRIVISNCGYISLIVILINSAGITVAVGYRITFRIEELFSGMMTRIIIGMNLYSIGAIHCHEIAIITEDCFPQEAPLAVVFPHHGCFAGTGGGKGAIRIVVVNRSLKQIAVIGICRFMGTGRYTRIRIAISVIERFFQEEILFGSAIHHAAGIGAGDFFRRIAKLIKICFENGRILYIIGTICILYPGVLFLIITNRFPLIILIHSTDNLAVFVTIVFVSGIPCFTLNQLHIHAVYFFPLRLIQIHNPLRCASSIKAIRAVDFPLYTGISAICQGIFIQDIVISFPKIPVFIIVAAIFALNHGHAVCDHCPFAIRAKVTDEVYKITAIVVFICHAGIAAQHLDQVFFFIQIINLDHTIQLIISIDNGSISIS